MDKQISVVIPYYPSPSRLELLIQCINALKLQTIDKELFEILVVIDGKNDELVSKLGMLDENILIIKKEHTGVCQTRNIGIENASGKFIAFLDDDCIPSKDWLKSFLDFNNLYPNFLAVGGRTLSYSNQSVFQRYADKRGLLSKPIIIGGEYFSLITANAFIDRKLLIRIGGFDKFFDNILGSCGGEDADISYKIRDFGISITFCEKAIIYHMHRYNLKSFISQQIRNGKGLILHTQFRNINIESLGFPKPTLFSIMKHLAEFIFINKDGSPSLLSRAMDYYKCDTLTLKDQFFFPLIDLLRRVSYYIGIFKGYKIYLSHHDSSNM